MHITGLEVVPDKYQYDDDNDGNGPRETRASVVYIALRTGNILCKLPLEVVRLYRVLVSG